ncbi:hypothetical protein NIES4071_71800 [Calothrix sp. NIES-4071]|nr:hypothetical protein NIES4071_71800 [Calothrix sp. NIES-4071]BAZ61455.1 hypothetical protein NIES4105_71750 [Calothrix sp. NIES-4105]
MYKNNDITQISDSPGLRNQENNEELLAAREEIELLRELVESQKLHTCKLENELLEVSQELEIINDQLAKALMLGVSYDEAKAIAKTILKDEEGGSELVAKLLNVIYGLSVKPEELKKIERSNIQTNPTRNQLVNEIIVKSKEIRNISKQTRLQYQELGCRFIRFQAIVNKIQEEVTNYRKSLV